MSADTQGLAPQAWWAVASHDTALRLPVEGPPLDPAAQEGPEALLRARLAARRLLGLLLREAALAGRPVPQASRPLARGPRGAPCFAVQADRQTWHLGLSHSPHHVAAVLGWQVAVGVDVDEPAPGLDWAQLAAHHFHPSEQWGLLRWHGQARDHQALRLWSAKEATLKAQGCGLHGRLDQTLIRPDGGGPAGSWQARAPDEAGAIGSGWSMTVGDGWLSACALQARPVAWTSVAVQP